MRRPAGHHGSVPDRQDLPSSTDRLPLMIDLSSTSLTPDERELLMEGRVSGVCLFGRNVTDRGQVGEQTDRALHRAAVVDEGRDRHAEIRGPDAGRGVQLEPERPASDRLPPGQAKKLYNIGQRFPVGYGHPWTYNQIPYDLRNRYGFDPRSQYYYGDGYLYRVDPATMLISQVVSAILR